MVTQNIHWIYQGKLLNSIEDFPSGTIGFIYEIRHEKDRWRYIGKKSLYATRTLPPLKGNTRKRRVTKESDWLKYCSSNKFIKGVVKEEGYINLHREILQVCNTKKLLTYYENKYLYCNSVIEPFSNYLNDNISGKLFKTDWQ